MANDVTVPADGQRPVNVGVVVIHGNGEAEPGWINTSIIARLQSRFVEARHSAATRGRGGKLGDGVARHRRRGAGNGGRGGRAA